MDNLNISKQLKKKIINIENRLNKVKKNNQIETNYFNAKDQFESDSKIGKKDMQVIKLELDYLEKLLKKIEDNYYFENLEKLKEEVNKIERKLLWIQLFFKPKSLKDIIKIIKLKLISEIRKRKKLCINCHFLMGEFNYIEPNIVWPHSPLTNDVRKIFRFNNYDLNLLNSFYSKVYCDKNLWNSKDSEFPSKHKNIFNKINRKKCYFFRYDEDISKSRAIDKQKLEAEQIDKKRKYSYTRAAIWASILIGLMILFINKIIEGINFFLRLL